MTTLAVAGWTVGLCVFVPCYFALVIYLTTKEYKPMSLSDRASRALRTFWQSFIPAALAIVSAKLGEVKGLSDLPAVWSVAAPLLLGAASSAVSAAWYSIFPPKPTV